MSTTLHIKQVDKAFNANPVLEHISLDIPTSSIVAFVGENGAGKSTLLKLISGLMYPDHGTITYAGLHSRQSSYQQRVSYVLESGQGYYSYLTALQNIEYFMAINAIKRSSWMPQLEELQVRYAFDNYLSTEVGKLSQGNRQKLSLIIAQLLDNPIMLLDEPTNGLDAATRELIARELIQLKNQGKIICTTTHDISFIMQTQATIILIKDHGIALTSSADDIQEIARNSIEYVLEFSTENTSSVLEICKAYSTTSYNIQEIHDRLVITTSSSALKHQLLQSNTLLEFSVKSPTAEQVLEKVLKDA